MKIDTKFDLGTTAWTIMQEEKKALFGFVTKKKPMFVACMVTVVGINVSASLNFSDNTSKTAVNYIVAQVGDNKNDEQPKITLPEEDILTTREEAEARAYQKMLKA